jgi:hypothetical protein
MGGWIRRSDGLVDFFNSNDVPNADDNMARGMENSGKVVMAKVPSIGVASIRRGKRLTPRSRLLACLALLAITRMPAWA